MGITIAQLNMLAQHFNFDINEARQLVGLATTSKSTNGKSNTSKYTTSKPITSPSTTDYINQ